MNKKYPNELPPEYKAITKYLLMGFSRNEIARKLNFSTSSISNRLSELFLKFRAKNKQEFILNIFQEILKEKQTEIKNKDILLKNSAVRLKNLTMLLGNVIKFKENKDKLLIWINKSEVYLKK